MAERFALPRLEDDLERLEEARLALVVGDAERVVAARAAATADAEVEAPLAQVVERRDLAGEAQGMIQGQELHGRAHAHAPGARGDPARHEQGSRQHRAGGVDQHLGQPHDVEPPRLRRRPRARTSQERVGLAGPAARLLQEDPEVQASRSACYRQIRDGGKTPPADGWVGKIYAVTGIGASPESRCIGPMAALFAP